MAANSYGLYSTVTFGVPAMTGMVLNAASLVKKPGVSVTVENESGRVVYERRDDIISEVSLDASFVTGSYPDVGTVVTWNGTKYIVESSELKYTNKFTATFNLKGKASEYLSLP